MTTITTLYTLPRVRQAQWIDSTGSYNVFNDARRVIADWADCSLAEIDFDDDDMICVDGEPVAFLEREYVRSPSAQIIPITEGRTAPVMMAAE